MGSVAEWFVVALTTTAKTDDGATRQVVFVTGAVVDFDLAFDPQRTVVIYGDFRRHKFNYREQTVLKSVVKSVSRLLALL